MLGALAEALTAEGRWADALATAERAVAKSARTGERFFLVAVHRQLPVLRERAGAPPETVEVELATAREVARETRAFGLLKRTASGQQAVSLRVTP